jgi:hypothetical protein
VYTLCQGRMCSYCHVSFQKLLNTLHEIWYWFTLEPSEVFVFRQKMDIGYLSRWSRNYGYGSQTFIIVLTTACHWTLLCANSIQLTPSYFISLKSTLILLSSHLCLHFLSDTFSSGFQTNMFHELLTLPVHVICPIHSILDLITLIMLRFKHPLASCSILKCLCLKPY